MTRILCTSVIALTGLTSAAFAQEAPVENWDGAFIGLQAGGFAGTSDYFNTRADGVLSTTALGDYDVEGALGGLYAGYNRQFGNLVLGIDSSISIGNADGGQDVGPGILTIDTELDFLTTVRGRAGLAFDRFLVFGTAGLAVARVETVIDQGGPASDENIHAGWTVGGGIEYRLSNNWSARAEYSYIDLGTRNYLLDFGDGNGPAVSNIDLEAHMIRAGIAYHLGDDVAAAGEPYTDWSGLYVGLLAGYAWDETEFANRLQGGSPAPFAFGEYDSDGWLAGGYVGYGRQYGWLVVGLDSSFSAADMSGGKYIPNPLDPNEDATIDTTLDFLATTTARVGVSWDRFMLYGLAGAALGHVELDFYQNGPAGDEAWHLGWAAGLGVEARLARNWSARLEYLHVDLGDEDYMLQFGPPGGAASSTVDFVFDLVRGGVTYRF